jgi:hypothetical protein
MDLGTGKTYETAEDAIAAGVPEADIVNTETGQPLRRRERWPEPTPNQPQGKRERERRLAKMKAGV